MPAATPNWRKRSRCLSSRLSNHLLASKPFTSQPNLVAKSVTSNCVIGAAPLLPASKDAHVVSRSLPIGVTRPMPVTTTRRMGISYRGLSRVSLRVGFDVVRRVLDGLDLLGIFLRNRDLELLLEGEHELHDGKRVRLQIVDERRFGAQLLGGYLELIADDFLDLALDLVRRHGGVDSPTCPPVSTPETQTISAQSAAHCVGDVSHQKTAIHPQNLPGDVPT